MILICPGAILLVCIGSSYQEIKCFFYFGGVVSLYCLFHLVYLKNCQHLLSYTESHIEFSCALCAPRDGIEKGMFVF